ncbi:transketolase [Lacticaseibacillus paracasei]|uniref:Putative transketolase n=1 Tax=Lacticaseibacillus paracasei subsp. paracasei Lpp126 TaxID=1256206 RepID=S2RRF6_LACPA|nr:transketolase [Lacticaseibacillus paracasei]EPC74051.1 putative transketolase [Lacticaseibacillus paracasei subsp. paracasei Lpp126]WCZ18215.1 transketolase [Lacticaseibacillus paracasei]
MISTETSELTRLAARIRYGAIKSIQAAGQGHIGGSLSIADTLAVLYGKQMNIRPYEPHWANRDWLVLSKGHAGPALYSALAASGFIDDDVLTTLNQGGTTLPSHPDRNKTPGVDATTGSLGQGTSQAAGIATGLRQKKLESYVYLIVGDGELNEGQCWEAFQYIASNKLNNCIVLIDNNKKQLDGWTDDIIQQFDIADKMRAFGFVTVSVDGSDVKEIDAAIDYLKTVKDSAVCIVLDTVKGAGVELFEKMADNHSVKFNDKKINDETDRVLMNLEHVFKGEKDV